MLKFYKSLPKFKLLSKQSTDLLFNGYDEDAETPKKLGYALGLGGGAPGINASIELDYRNEYNCYCILKL